jgi:hypothetical protein
VRGHPSRCGSATSDPGQFLGDQDICAPVHGRGFRIGQTDRSIRSDTTWTKCFRHAGLCHIARAAESIREQAANDPAATIPELKRRLLEAERAAARHEVGHLTRIARTEDIPCPFACGSDEIGWIVPGLIPARGVTIIAGEAGPGKTWLALALARALTLGGDFLGRRRSVGAQVLYLDWENPLNLIRDRLQVLFGGASEFRPWGLWCVDEPSWIGDPRLLEFARQVPLHLGAAQLRPPRTRNDQNQEVEAGGPVL